MNPTKTSSRTLALGSLLLAPSLLCGAAEPPATTAPKSSWTVSVGLSARETYDSNVYLQDIGGTPVLPDTARPEQDSLVTTLGATTGLAYKPSASFGASFGYSVETHVFHDAGSEDNTHHRLSADLKGKSGEIPWDFTNSVLFIDGEDRGLAFAAPGEVPAAGGIPLRDRRDATVYRHAAKTTLTFGDWFVRPLASIYYHDFRTEHISGRQNYADRSDYQAGADVGTTLGAFTTYVGYRRGYQHQSRVFGTGAYYSNHYDRLLLGVEGPITSKLKVKLLAGPDFRDIGGIVAARVKRDSTELFVDSSITYTPTTSDTFTVAARRFMQPGYGGRSIYNDSTYDLTWRRKLSAEWSVGAGYRAYNTDFRPAARRDDWVYTASVNTTYAVNSRTTLEAAYSRDTTDSDIPSTPGREFTRDLVSIGVRYQFR
jgi:hypothetical protein